MRSRASQTIVVVFITVMGRIQRIWQSFKPAFISHISDTEASYSVYRSGSRVDPYQAAAIKELDPEFWKSTRGYSQQPGQLEDMPKALSLFDRPYAREENLSQEWRSALDLAFLEFEDQYLVASNLVPLSLKASVKFLKRNKSSGYPYFRRKGEVIEDLLFDASKVEQAALRTSRLKLQPATLAIRGSLTKVDEPKTRIVWCYSGSSTLIEGMFAQPLINHFMTIERSFLLVGKAGLMNIRNVLAGDVEHIYRQGYDWSKFDTSVAPYLIHRCFDIFYKLFDFSCEIGPSRLTRLTQHQQLAKRRLFRAVENFFVHTDFITPDGRMWRKHGGIPSGSYFTNILDSIINWVLLRAAFRIFPCGLAQLYTNGDDSAFVTSRPVTPVFPKIVAAFKRYFKMSLHTLKKSQVDVLDPSMFQVSGCHWPGGCPSRSDFDLFNLLLHPKQWVPDLATSLGRLIGIYLCGGYRSERFVRYFHNFQRGFDCRIQPRFNSEMENLLIYGAGFKKLPQLLRSEFTTSRFLFLPWALYLDSVFV